MIPSWLPDRGSVLLYGASGSYQSLLAFDAACAVASEGGQVVVLIEGDGDLAILPGKVIEWRNAHRVPIGTRLRVGGLIARHLDPVALRRDVFKVFRAKPDLILRDFSLSGAPFDADGWLREAAVLAAENDCAVLTSLADSHHSPVDTALADTVWRSEPFHDPATQNSCNARLTRERPLPSMTVEYAGQQAGRMIVFTEMEPAHG